MQTLNKYFGPTWDWIERWVGEPIARVVTSWKFWGWVGTGAFITVLLSNATNVALGIERADRGLLVSGLSGLVSNAAALAFICFAFKASALVAKSKRLTEQQAKTLNEIQGQRDRLAEQIEENDTALYKAALNLEGVNK